MTCYGWSMLVSYLNITCACILRSGKRLLETCHTKERVIWLVRLVLCFRRCRSGTYVTALVCIEHCPVCSFDVRDVLADYVLEFSAHLNQPHECIKEEMTRSKLCDSQKITLTCYRVCSDRPTHRAIGFNVMESDLLIPAATTLTMFSPAGIFSYFISTIVCPLYYFSLPPQFPQVTCRHWGEIDAFSAKSRLRTGWRGLISQRKISRNTPPWPGIEPGP